MCLTSGVQCFFFSSRRRHTICSRDWSSDVCSSDLTDAGSCCLRFSITARTRPATATVLVPGCRWIASTIARLLRSEEHTSELQSRLHLVCRLLLEKKKKRAALGGA